MKTKSLMHSIILGIFLISSISVFGGSNSKNFGVGESSGVARVSAYYTSGAQATTYPNYNSYDVSTGINALGYPDSGWRYGEYSAYSDIPAACRGAESFHSIDGMSTYLSYTYN